MEILSNEDYPQGSESWFKERAGVLTGSRLGKCITPKTGKLSAQHTTVIAELIAECLEFDRRQVSSYWMERGVLLEPEARDWYAFARGVEVEQVGFIKNKGLGFSPDGLVGDDGLLEIKCPKPATHIKWLLSGELPDEHKAQVLGGVYICERDWCDFESYCPGAGPFLVHVHPSDHATYYENLKQSLEEFKDAYDGAKKRILGDDYSG